MGDYKENYEDLFMNSPISYLVLDSSGKIVISNYKSRCMLGDEKLDGKQFIKFIKEENRTHYQDKIDSLSSSNFEKFESILLVGKIEKHVMIKINLDDNNRVRLVLKDNTVEKININDLSYASYHDQLTGLYNRHYLNEVTKKMDNLSYYPLGVIMADINGLKLINDAFGHSNGDELIKMAAQSINDSLRCRDVLTRVGGDEFIALLPNTDTEMIESIIERVRENTSKQLIKEIPLSVAFGYAIKESPRQNLSQLINDAESKMYKDKMYSRKTYRKRTIDGLLESLFKKHPIEEEHAFNVSEYALLIGEALDYSPEKLNFLRVAALLHDIGKIGLDYSIIEKEASLSVDEYELVKEHSEIGYRVLYSASIFGDIPEIVLSHHERVDGKGYPRGLKGEEISEEARIICICDAFDAMCSDRPYKAKMTKEKAIKELIACKDTYFDSKLVDLFVSKIK